MPAVMPFRSCSDSSHSPAIHPRRSSRCSHTKGRRSPRHPFITLWMRSENSRKEIKEQLKGPTGQALDNLDVHFRTEQPTVEKGNRLVHMTTATFLPLHDASMEDLKCAEEIRSKSEYNEHREPSVPAFKASYDALLDLAAKRSLEEDDPAHESKLRAWRIRDVLFQNVSALKTKFDSEQGSPVPRLQIPLRKTTQIPARAMNLMSERHRVLNAAALRNLQRQAGLSDEHHRQYVMLTHGDLGTGEKILALQKSRRIEDRIVNRFNHIVFVPRNVPYQDGLRRFNQEALYRPTKDEQKTTPYRQAHHPSLLRSTETSPNRDVTVKSRLPNDPQPHKSCFVSDNNARLEVKKRTGKTLEEWLKAEPKWEEILAISEELLASYVADWEFEPDSSKDGAVQTLHLLSRCTPLCHDIPCSQHRRRPHRGPDDSMDLPLEGYRSAQIRETYVPIPPSIGPFLEPKTRQCHSYELVSQSHRKGERSERG